MPQAIPVKSPIFLFYQDNDVGVDKIGIGEYASYKGNLYVLDNKANVDKTTTILQAVMHRNLLPLDMDTFINQILNQMHQNGLIITAENLNKNFMNKAEADGLYIKSKGLGKIEAGDLFSEDNRTINQVFWRLKPGRYYLDINELNEKAQELQEAEQNKPEDEQREMYRWWGHAFSDSTAKYIIDLQEANDIRVATFLSDIGSDAYWMPIPKEDNGSSYLHEFAEIPDPYKTVSTRLSDVIPDLTPGAEVEDGWRNHKLFGLHALTMYSNDRMPTGCPVQDKKALVRISNLSRSPDTYFIEIVSETEGLWYTTVNYIGGKNIIGSWHQVQGGGKGGGDVPVGTVLSWDNTLPIPTGYAAADGSEISKTDYSDLFNLVGNTFGQASDVNKFKLPNITDNNEVSSEEATPSTLVKRDDQGTIKAKMLELTSYFPVATGVEPDKLKDKGYSILVWSTYGTVQMISAKDFFEKTLRGFSGGGTTITGTNSAITLDVDANDNIDVNGELYIEGTTSDLNVERGDYFQAGQYGFFAMKNPKGRWLFCDGREISREAYSDLFEAIGTTYGEGNGTTTFNIPDRRGYFGRCLDAGAEVDYQSNREIGSKQSDAIRNITGKMYDNHLSSMNDTEGALVSTVMGTAYQYIGQGTYFGLNTDFDASRVVPTAPENVVKNIAEYVCIRY